MNGWKITSQGYVNSAEKQTEHFEIYISKNEQETFFWLRIYQNYRIFSEYHLYYWLNSPHSTNSSCYFVFK